MSSAHGNQPTFVTKLVSANPTIIASSKREDVRKVSIAFLLEQRLRIPIFQRRYCWSSAQWNTLLDDALSVVEGEKGSHSLGRITCVVGGSSRANDSGVTVIDGQQRNTSAVLLLAAIRDIVHTRNSDATSAELESKLDSLLFPDTVQLQSWMSQRPAPIEIDEGEALDFASLIPTYCDRSPFFAAILPPSLNIVCRGGWHRPMEAKQFFVENTRQRSTEQLSALADVVLHKLEWLFFPIDMSNNDGTSDLQVVFERLALRDQMICKPHRKSEYADMGAADFIRNLLLGSFGSEADAIRTYQHHWLRLEQASSELALQRPEVSNADILETMFDAFLQANPVQPIACVGLDPMVGGSLYKRFRDWLAGMNKATSTEQQQQHLTEQIVKQLVDFGLEYFAKFGSRENALSSIVTNQGKWQCSRCRFMNIGGAQCTACGLFYSKPNRDDATST